MSGERLYVDVIIPSILVDGADMEALLDYFDVDSLSDISDDELKKWALDDVSWLLEGVDVAFDRVAGSEEDR